MRIAVVSGCLLGTPIAALAAPSPRGMVAVLDFRNKLKDPTEIDVGYLADRVRGGLLEELPTLRVITRENLLVLLAASGKKMEDCEGECEVDTGRRIGADYVISGEVLRFGTALKLNLRMHDTHSSELLSSAIASGKTVDELDAAVGATLTQLLAVFKSAPDASPSAGAAPPAGRVPPAPRSGPRAAPALPLEPDLESAVMAARSVALQSEAFGFDNLGAAITAWDRLSSVGTNNPYRRDALDRAAYWREYQARRTKLAALMRSNDVAAEQKPEMLRYFAQGYGGAALPSLIAEIQPPAARSATCAALASVVPARHVAVAARYLNGRPLTARVSVDGKELGATPLEAEVASCATVVAEDPKGTQVARTLAPGTQLDFFFENPQTWVVSLQAGVAWLNVGQSETQVGGGVVSGSITMAIFSKRRSTPMLSRGFTFTGIIPSGSSRRGVPESCGGWQIRPSISPSGPVGRSGFTRARAQA